MLEIFEVDHPATQTMKTHRICECGISLPPSVHFISSDLANEDLVAALARSSFRNDEAAFFSWLGVTVHLTREANLSTLRAVAICSSPGSEIVFTYVDKLEFTPDRSQSSHNDNAPVVAAIGEPYRSGFDPNEIAKDFMSVGLELVEDLDGRSMWERYAGASTTIQ